MYMYIYMRQNVSTSEFPLKYYLGMMFGSPQLHFSKLSWEIFDLNFPKM